MRTFSFVFILALVLSFLSGCREHDTDVTVIEGPSGTRILNYGTDKSLVSFFDIKDMGTPEHGVEVLNTWLGEHPDREVTFIETKLNITGMEYIKTYLDGFRVWTRLKSDTKAPRQLVSMTVFDDAPKESKFSVENYNLDLMNQWLTAHPEQQVLHIETVSQTSGFKSVDTWFEKFRLWTVSNNSGNDLTAIKPLAPASAPTSSVRDSRSIESRVRPR